MMAPQLMQAIAKERDRDRQRSVAAHHAALSDPPSRRRHRVTVGCGYWLISVGRRLVASDLTPVAR